MGELAAGGSPTADEEETANGRGEIKLSLDRVRTSILPTCLLDVVQEYRVFRLLQPLKQTL